MSTKNTGRKFNHLQDDLHITGRGLYALTPFARMDKDNKMLIKVGMSHNLVRRDQSRQTDFPMGFYYVALVHNITLKTSKEKSPNKTLDEHVKEMEKYAFELCEKSRHIDRIRSTLAIKHLKSDEPEIGGLTEWVYAKPKDIQEIFRKVVEKYGGELSELPRFDKRELDEKQDALQRKDNTYTGEITYPIPKKK